jgi:ArsR family transcriptional regulator, zinc-responsive transcriptional repressor
MCYLSHMSLNSAALEPAAGLFKALGSPLRLAVVTALDEAGPLCVHELVSRLDVPQPLVSQHLRILREADVVRGVRRGKEIAYEIADDHVAHVVRDAVRHTGEDRSRTPSKRRAASRHQQTA